jgi:hypothetical protein
MSAERQVDPNDPKTAGERRQPTPRRIGLAGQLDISAKVGSHESLGQLVLDRCNGSHSDAVKVLSYVAAFGVFTTQAGREPRSVNELGTASSRRSRATLERWQTAFQRAFPEYSTPAVLWAMVRDQVEVTDETLLALTIGAATV